MVTNWGLQAQGFEYRPYRGATYEAYVKTSDGSNNLIIKRCVKNAGCTEKNLGGTCTANVRLDADVDQNFLVVAARGTGNDLYVRVLRGDPNLSASDFGFDGWKALGGYNITGAPLVTGTRGAVMVTVPGGDGTHNTRITSDGINFGDNTTGWLADRSGIKTGSGSLGNDGRFDYILDSLTAMKAGTHRVYARFDDPSNCQLNTVSHTQQMLDQIINWGGVRTVIIRTGEHCTDYNSVENLLRYSSIGGDATGQNIQNFIFNRQNILFYIEIGNEPDKHQPYVGRDAYTAGTTARDTVNQLRQEYEYSHPNMKFMLSLPTRDAGDTYFRDFARGSQGAKYEAVAPHLYASNTFGDYEAAALDYASLLWPGVPQYITEINVNAHQAGLDENWTAVANRIRAAEDGVMYFGIWQGYRDGRNTAVRAYDIFIQDRDVKWCNDPTKADAERPNYAFDYYRNGTATCEPLNHNGANQLGVNR